MNYPRVATRYSKALLDLAVEQNDLDRISSDVAVLKEAIKGSEELKSLLKSPVVKADKKQAVLNEIFSGSFSPLFDRFIALLTKNGRENVLAGICEKFEKDVLEYKGILEAEVTTAVALTEADRTKLIETLKKQLGKEIILSEKIDTSTIGGMKLLVGGFQLDNTISGKLKALRSQLVDKSYEAKN